MVGEYLFWLAKLYGLANQKWYYFQMLLNLDKSGEQEEHSSEWLVNTDTGVTCCW